MIRNLRDLIGIARRAVTAPPREHHNWRSGDLSADVWRTYWGWRWVVRDEEGALLGESRSADSVGAMWAAERVMRRHAEGVAA
jgi:hypothetical protein